jgi:hypothetical protein
MSLITPLPGDAHFTSGLSLSKNIGEPILTLSPILTINFGLTPLKSDGSSANTEAAGAKAIFASGSPEILIS